MKEGQIMHEWESVPDLSALISKIYLPKALIWDMDGTVIYSEFLHAMSIEAILHRYHEIVPTWQEIESFSIGETDEIVFYLLQDKSFLPNHDLEQFLDEKKIVFDELLLQTERDKLFNPAIEKLFQECHQRNIPLALVTSSEKETTIKLLTLFNLLHHFQFVITREDTEKNKPDPMPYQEAMRRLNLTPNEVIIFEDSVPGLQAAMASKASVVKVGWY